MDLKFSKPEKSMTEVIKNVKDIIEKSNVLLEKDVVTIEEKTNYKRICLDFFFLASR